MINAIAPLIAASPLAVRLDIMRELSSGFNKEPAPLVHWLVSLALAAVLLALLFVADRRLQHHRKSAPRRNLLAEACQAVNLAPEERAVLERLAARARLPWPTAMLLSPANLSGAYERAFSDRPEPEFHASLDGICRKLYGTPLPNAPSSPTSRPEPKPDRLRPFSGRPV